MTFIKASFETWLDYGIGLNFLFLDILSAHHQVLIVIFS